MRRRYGRPAAARRTGGVCCGRGGACCGRRCGVMPASCWRRRSAARWLPAIPKTPTGHGRAAGDPPWRRQRATARVEHPTSARSVSISRRSDPEEWGGSSHQRSSCRSGPCASRRRRWTHCDDRDGVEFVEQGRLRGVSLFRQMRHGNLGGRLPHETREQRLQTDQSA